MSAGTFYTDSATAAALQAGRGARQVLLIGSYGGFPNFGDVLQLKGALQWHRENTGLEPVLVCHLSAVPDAGFCARQRKWFGVGPILYWCHTRLDAEEAGLRPFDAIVGIAHLHVYGGGFLNRYWGQGTIAILEALLERFGCPNYVLSGQQIDERLVPELREHFGRHRPQLTGGRDPNSVQLLAACGAPAADSFDDAIRLLQSWRRAEGPAADLLLHLNLSYYTGTQGLDPLIDTLARLAETLRVQANGREPRVVLLHAYGDRRTDEILDTLGAVSFLEDRFPFLHYEVAELGQAALRTPDSNAAIVPAARMAVSCSYHVSILCTLLGTPCFMLARNDYYQQKRAGLNMASDLATFLQTPQRADLQTRLEVRSAWEQQLKTVFAPPVSPKTPASYSPQPPAGTAWQPKRGLDARQSSPLTTDLRQQLVELKAHSEKLWQELKHLGHEFDLRGERVRELEAELNRIWDELQHMRRGFDERGQRIHDLEQLTERLRTDAQATQAALGTHQARGAELNELLAERTAELQRLETQLRALQRRSGSSA